MKYENFNKAIANLKSSLPLNPRNLLTHIYRDIDSSATIENIKHKYYDAFNDLKREIDENWRE